nr:MAG TPA: Helix-turn-helix XRE-family like protein [Caudoviricetes sp.]
MPRHTMRNTCRNQKAACRLAAGMEDNMSNIYQAARLQKGITQERAADAIPCSVRSLADYESGVRIPPSETVVRMAEIYDAQYLCYQHLRQTSEIARRLIPDVRECALPEAVLRLIDEIYDFADAREDRRLIAIAKDGTIDENERPEFDRIVSKLADIIQAALAVTYNNTGG